MRNWQNVVVGVDGSEGSERALAWAADEAREHQAKLTVVLVWSYPLMPVAPGYASLAGNELGDLNAAGQHELTRVLTSVLGTEPDLTVERLVVEGHPAQRILEASADADLAVVGCRGHGGFAGMLLGSVSQHVAAHARCPVVVVR